MLRLQHALPERYSDATPAELWNERFAVYSAAFEAIVGPQEGPPTGYKGKEAGVSR